MDPRELDKIGPYEVVEFIAEGGMAWVFKVFDAKFEESRYAGRQIIEILPKSTQRSFGGPSGGKSDAADPFLVVPRASFELFFR